MHTIDRLEALAECMRVTKATDTESAPRREVVQSVRRVPLKRHGTVATARSPARRAQGRTRNPRASRTHRRRG